MTRPFHVTRRALLATAGAVAGLRVASAAGLIPTPRQTRGPFYPAALPLDSDTDLVTVAGRDAPARGVVTHVFGRVLAEDCRPLAGTQVEIWQCDALGRYHHPREPRGGADPNFQGYGRMVVGEDGAYRFRTIRPVPYPGRTPHIHFALTGAGLEPLVTQMYVAGEPGNASDFILNAVRDPERRARLIVPLRPAPELETGALAGRFDLVLGGTMRSG